MTGPATNGRKASNWTPRRIVIIVLLVVALALIAANFSTQSVNLLVAEIRMPLSLLLIAMFGLGWATCALVDKLRK